MTESDSTKKVLLRDNGLVLVLDRNERVEGVPPRWRKAVEAVVRDAELALPAAAVALARGIETTRGVPGPAEGDIRLLRPLSVVTLDDRPTFSWQGQEGVRYRVEIYDPRFALLVASEVISVDSWQPPSALPRGELLTWRLAALRGRREEILPVPPAPPAIFEIASTAEAGEVEEARATGSRLLVGLALWHAGAIGEAASELEALRKENKDSVLARQLAESSSRGVARLGSGMVRR